MADEKVYGKFNVKALTASVILHAVIFSAFAYLNLDKTVANNSKSAKTAAVIAVEKTIPKERIYPKPDIIKPESGSDKSQQLKELQIDFPSLQTKKTVPDIQTQVENTIINSVEESFFKNVEFYGTESVCSRICFVVDGSGSMQGQFNSVKQRLINSISALQQNQFFAIIIYTRGRLIQLPQSRYYRASRKNITSAKKQINMVRPGGVTNAFSAIEKALEISSRQQESSTIFFLTDGFEIYQTLPEVFVNKIVSHQKNIASSTPINTIGFRGNDKSNQILKQIADLTGGRFALAD